MDHPTRTFERVRRINDGLAEEARCDGLTAVSVPFICECDRDGCFHPVWTRLDDYAALRRDGGRLLAAGHEGAEVLAGAGAT